MAAVLEHILHVGDPRGVERAHVEALDYAQRCEHGFHVGDLLGVEVAYVEASEILAKGKHAIHVGDVAGVEVVQPRDGSNTHSIEPLIAAGGSGIGKRGVERHRGDVCTAGIPTWVVAGSVHVVDVSSALSHGVEVVVVEGE